MARRRKKDEAEIQTDELLDELEKRIVKEYSAALKEIQEKYDEFAAKFKEQDKQKKKDLKSGKITQEQYDKWRLNKLFEDERYRNLATILAEDLAKVDQKVMSIANGYMPQAYALNFNYSTYEIEQGTNINTNFTLYSRETVEKLIKDGSITLPKRKVDIPKDQLWNKQHINSAILQGILQGDSIPDISKRLQQVTDMDRRAAVRNARTMMTGAQNSGRMAAYERADKLGIKIQKEWMATLDHRTRDSHQQMDGERMDWKKPFSNKLMYPGDPEGEPAEVYNCRCTMVPFYPEYANIITERVTYNEWLQGKNPEEKIIKQIPIDHRQWIDKVYSKRYKEKQREEIAQLYSQAPYEVQQFYDKYAGEMREMEDNGRTKQAYFTPSGQHIYLNGKEDIAGNDYQNKYQTSTHEFGHNMDFLAGGKSDSYLSEKYRDKNGRTFGQIINDEWYEYFKQRYGIDSKKDYLGPKIREFCEEIKNNYSMAERGDLSDIFEKFSVKNGGPNYPFSVGHGTNYWKRSGALEREAFAEMLDSTIANPEAAELIKKYLPNSYNAFLDMIKQEVSK